MNKPSTAELRSWVRSNKTYIHVEVRDQIVRVCDYIDSLPTFLYEAQVQEAEDRVRAEIREFVLNKTTKYEASFSPKTYIKLVDVNQILDFIDNGPKKLTAEDVLDRADRLYEFQSEQMSRSAWYARSLREAGLLKED